MPSTTREDRWDFDFDRSITTVEGSNVANHLLRELMEAVGEPLVARGASPREVWREMLDKVQTLRESGLLNDQLEQVGWLDTSQWHFYEIVDGAEDEMPPEFVPLFRKVVDVPGETAR